MDLAFALGMGFLIAIETLYIEVQFNGAPYAPRSMNMYSQPRAELVPSACRTSRGASCMRPLLQLKHKAR